MAKFKVVTPAGVSYGAPGASYELEMEALGPLGAEIVEVTAKTDDDFTKAARDADALYAKGRPITKRIIDGLERCRVIALGSVGVDSVDVAAATARGIPVTNVPDTFIGARSSLGTGGKEERLAAAKGLLDSYAL